MSPREFKGLLEASKVLARKMLSFGTPAFRVEENVIIYLRNNGVLLTNKAAEEVTEMVIHEDNRLMLARLLLTVAQVVPTV